MHGRSRRSAGRSDRTARSTRGRESTWPRCATGCSRRCASSSRRRGGGIRLRRDARHATATPAGGQRTGPARAVDAACRAMQAHDVDSAVGSALGRLVYDDRRRLSGDPVEGLAGLRAATVRFLEQYAHCRVRAHWRFEVSAWHWLGAAGGRRRERGDVSRRFRGRRATDGSPSCPVRRGRLRRAYRELEQPVLRGRGRGVRAERPRVDRMDRGDGPARRRGGA